MQVGQVVSHYKILRHLGGGGMGVAYNTNNIKIQSFQWTYMRR